MSKERLIKISIRLASTVGRDVCSPCGGKCCKQCAGNRGYLPEKQFQEAKAKYGFDAPTMESPGLGFMGEEGCKLPREVRSIVCLHFWCHTATSHFSDEEKKLFSESNSLYHKAYNEERKLT